MEKLPSLGTLHRFPIRVMVHPFLFDHTTKTGAVLPAVQTMQILAFQVRQLAPHHLVHFIKNASFEKLLLLPAGEETMEAILEIEPLSAEILRAALLTKTRSKSGIGRTLRHAVMEFSGAEIGPISPGKRLATDLSTFEDEIPVNGIYPGLVSFGPLFQNVITPIKLFREGATTRVTGGVPVPEPCLLGSPFPLDAAFHAACAWGRHFIGQVCFPVAFQSRVIVKPTRPGELYQTAIRFLGEQQSGLTFDLVLYDANGDTCEFVSGLLMKEIGT